jgi:branched-chain amino acid transport system substrate-binding protein
MVKYVRLSAVLAVLLLVVAACQSPGGGGSTAASASAGASGGGGDGENVVTYAAGEPIELGAIMVITGPNATLGLDTQYGVEAAIMLRGQVAGHDVNLTVEDGLCTADGGATAARAITSNPQIAAVIGTSCSSAGVPASQITSDAGIPMVSPSNTAPSLTDPATHERFYLRTAHNDTVQGAAMAQFVCEELGHTVAATLHDGTPYTEQLAAVFADSFNESCGEIVATEAVTPGQADYTSVLTAVADAGPEFIYYPLYVPEGALVTQQSTEIMPDADRGGADGMLSPDMLSAAGETAEGMYLSGPDLEFSGDFYTEEFLPAYQEVSGEDEPIQVFHAHAYDAATMIFNAIEEVGEVGDDGSLTIDRDALAAALFASNFEGITGNIACDENGDCADPQISVRQVQDGEFVRIWPE